MTDFEATLKRAFAETPEPVDEGFSLRVIEGVGRRERLGRVHGTLLAAGAMVAGLAVAYALYLFLSVFGQGLLAGVGLEFARAHSALSEAPAVMAPAQGLMQTLGAGLTQILLVVGALAGGAVAYRSAQD